MRRGLLTVASLGDSVCTLVRQNGSYQRLSYEHTPRNEDERQRIINNQGFIIRGRVQSELEVTRAIGNRSLKSLVIAEPETTQHILNACDDLLILSSDGLYKTYTNEHIVKRVLQLREVGYTLAQISDKIIDECLQQNARPANDNITLLIIDLAAYFRDCSTTQTFLHSQNQLQHRVHSPVQPN